MSGKLIWDFKDGKRSLQVAELVARKIRETFGTVADKAKGLPVDFIDPVEGNFMLTEAAAVVDKGDKTNPNAQKVVEVIIKNARPELLQYYPVALYKGETVSAENKPANPKQFPEALTVELLQKHQKLVKGE